MKSTLQKKLRLKSESMELKTTLQINSIATKYLELLGGVKSFEHRSTAAFVPKQILRASKLPDSYSPQYFRATTGVLPKGLRTRSVSSQELTWTRSLPEGKRGLSRGVIKKGSTVTTKYVLSRTPLNPYLPLSRKPSAFPLHTREQVKMQMRRTFLRLRLKTPVKVKLAEPQIAPAPWTFEGKRSAHSHSPAGHHIAPGL